MVYVWWISDDANTNMIHVYSETVPQSIGIAHVFFLVEE